MEVGRTELTNPIEIANSFGQFFVSIELKLAEELAANHDPSQSNSMPETSRSFFLHPTDPEEVASTIRRLQNTAADMDHITATVLKAATNAISALLSSVIINTSFRINTSPQSLKRVVVSPIHIAKSRKVMSNYPPISVLPALSKIERKLFIGS